MQKYIQPKSDWVANFTKKEDNLNNKQADYFKILGI